MAKINQRIRNGNGNSRRENGWLDRTRRMIRYKLHIPMIRSPHPPEFTARGVMIGTIWAMVPVFGLQMLAVLITWIIAEKALRWEFSLVNGLAWTWTTNIVTIIPTYYVYYVTGQVLLGHFDDISGYDGFHKLFTTSTATDAGFWDKFLNWIETLITGWGVPLLIGSIPWTILCGWLAYAISLRFVREYQRRRAVRMQDARDRNSRARTAATVDTPSSGQ
ncbi:hypothetical protein GGD81_004708 [Rhodobium orientis]|uniref:DUF2062 domain-containing protein n=1 Tax=Rhodobium orientis TaxID=34017 RepID=A0A327JDY0_9HYPH|nr:DUF2062 domain-containing protein [Rhodobium orientis]MBB4305627.1 hypothetical protein [Rhodobium orientis]MBK5948716.1 hypothetical protein [Rhodobium orientis]RAI23864.1 hypothetical protein CH339_23020 [Rhodobium orientis]